MNIDELIKSAKSVRNRAHCPHSKFKVGAALQARSGKIYTGCNIENHGIMSICAERVAFTKAISEGEKEFECILVCGGIDSDNMEECLPCGYCRQFMSEFVSNEFIIYSIDKAKKITKYKLKELLPYSFRLNNK